jgi:mannosyltransferase
MRARSVAIVAGLTVIAAALRLWHLGAKDVWADEAVAISLARLPWHEFRRVITNREANAAFYELLLRAWTGGFGVGAAAARSLSAAAGIATVPALFIAARRLLSERVALVAAGLLAVNTYHVRYSQEARGYALVTLLVVLATWAFVRVLSEPGFSLRPYIVLATLAIYTHMFAALVMAAHVVAALTYATSVRRSRLMKVWMWIGVLCAPLALFAKTKDIGQIDWIPRPSLELVGTTLVDFSGRGNLMLTVLVAMAVIAGLIEVWRSGHDRRFAAALIAGWCFLPPAIALALSFVKPMFLPRYLIVALPALAVLAGTGIATLGAGTSRIVPALRWGLLVAIVAMSVDGVQGWYKESFDPPPQRWRDAVRLVARESKPSDALVFYHPWARMPFEFAEKELHLDTRATVLFPALPDARMMLAAPREMDGRELLPGGTRAGELEKRERVWLVRNGGDAIGALLEQSLTSVFERRQAVNFGAGIDVFEYSRPIPRK